jgi:hypothetical protein
MPEPPAQRRAGPQRNHQRRLAESHEQGERAPPHLCLRGDAQRQRRESGRRTQGGVDRRSHQLSVVCRPLVPHGRLSDGPVYRGDPCTDSRRLPGGGQRQHRQSPQVSGGLQEYSFNWTRPSFPGTIIAGKFNEPGGGRGLPNVRVYLTDAHKQSGPEFAQTANKEFDFFGETFRGVPLPVC